MLGSPEPEVGGHKAEGVTAASKKTMSSTKSSFEHFKRQAMEKSERVRGLSLCSMIVSL